MNMPLAASSPDSTTTQGTLQRHPQGFQQGQPAGGPASSLYKMDAMMFPSEDPFAYPNQPMMDAAGHHPGSQTPQSAAGQSHDAMQFYIPTMYDGIEGQLLEPMPSYLMQQAPRPAQHGLDTAAAQMYNSPSMLAMQPDHGGHAHQPPQQHHIQQMAQHPQHPQHQQQQHQPQQHQPQQHQPQQHQPQQQQQQQGDGMMDEMLTDPTFRSDWDEMLGTTGYR